MEITVRVEVQYLAPENAVLLDVLQMFRRPMWVRFMMRYISPRLKNASPADKNVLQSLETEWRLPSCSEAKDDNEDKCKPGECVICMADTPRPNVEHVRLPCGHAFHYRCVQSWLQLRSTCPVCRFQFNKAFAGTYAVHSLVSTVLLSAEQRALSRKDVLRTSVEKQLVRAVVNVTLVRVMSEEKKKEYPCELSALVMHTDGEVFSEYDVFPAHVIAACDPNLGGSADAKDASTPTTGDERVGSVRAHASTSCDLHDDQLDDDDRQFKRLRRA